MKYKLQGPAAAHYSKGPTGTLILIHMLIMLKSFFVRRAAKYNYLTMLC